RGNCYVTCEALYHLLGGKAAGLVPHTLRHEGAVHWYLEHRQEFYVGGLYKGVGFDADHGPVRRSTIIDPTASQFKTPPDYSKGRARGFLTKQPSKRARALMERLVWQ